MNALAAARRVRYMPVNVFKASGQEERAVVVDLCVPRGRLSLKRQDFSGFYDLYWDMPGYRQCLYSVSGATVARLERMGLISCTRESVSGHKLDYEPTVAGAELRAALLYRDGKYT